MAHVTAKWELDLKLKPELLLPVAGFSHGFLFIYNFIYINRKPWIFVVYRATATGPRSRGKLAPKPTPKPNPNPNPIAYHSSKKEDERSPDYKSPTDRRHFASNGHCSDTFQPVIVIVGARIGCWLPWHTLCWIFVCGHANVLRSAVLLNPWAYLEGVGAAPNRQIFCSV